VRRLTRKEREDRKGRGGNAFFRSVSVEKTMSLKTNILSGIPHYTDVPQEKMEVKEGEKGESRKGFYFILQKRSPKGGEREE